MEKVLSARPCWVRWRSVGATTAWQKAQGVSITDGWLVIITGPQTVEAIPQHVVRGPVEITELEPPAPEPSRPVGFR